MQLSRVSFSYGSQRRAVDSVSAEFGRGELVSLIGPNGSGKTTVMKMMARVVQPGEGEVVFDARPLREWNAREFARNVGYLPQDPEPAFPMRAFDVVLSGRGPFLSRFRWESDEDYDAAREALEQVDATDLGDRFLEEMSGGERKRIFLARVLAGKPRMILLDEPLASLDVAHIQSFTSLLRSIVDDLGTTVLFISHDLNWSAAYSDRMLVMSGGRLVLDGAPAEVMRPDVMKRFFRFDAEAVPAGGSGGSWIVPPSRRS